MHLGGDVLEHVEYQNLPKKPKTRKGCVFTNMPYSDIGFKSDIGLHTFEQKKDQTGPRYIYVWSH